MKGLTKDLSARLLADRHTGRDLPRSGRSERVSDSDGPSVEVDLLKVDAELLDRVDSLRGKGLVDLPEVDVLDGETTGELED